MIKSKNTKLASAVGTAVMAMALSAPANAAISLGGSDGWEVTYGGFINLFYTQQDWDFGTGAGSEDSSHLQEGLLPAFHTFTARSPTVGGLTGTAQITFAPDSSGSKGKELNKGGAEIDMREVFFNVEGSFGTISAGRTLALYQRQAILKDYSLFGMGAVPGPDAGGAGLGRIGFGYIYLDFRTRFVYQSNVMNGFQVSVGIFDPDEGIAAGGLFSNNFVETDTPQFQGEATYTTDWQGGTLFFWAGGLWQTMEIKPGAGLGNITSSDIDSWGYDLGGDITFGGFNVGGHYYDGEALGTLFLLSNAFGVSFTCSATGCSEGDADGFYVQGSYTFNGKTKLGVSYGESTTEGGGIDTQNDLWTVAVYHDVNPWLKLIAEYGSQHSDFVGTGGGHDAKVFSVGGFILW